MTTTDQRPRGPWRALLTLSAVLAGAFVAVVLAGALAQPASASGGLTGYCYNYTNINSPFATPIGTSRIDSTLNVNFGTSGATCYNATTTSDSYSVRWTGTLTTESSSSIKFKLATDDGQRLTFNGSNIFDNLTANSLTNTSGSISVSPNTTYPIEVVLVEKTGSASINLQWDPTGGSTFATIPTSNLTPVTTGTIRNTDATSGKQAWLESWAYANSSSATNCAAGYTKDAIRVTFLVAHDKTTRVTGLEGDTNFDGTPDVVTGYGVESADRPSSSATPDFNYSLVTYSWTPSSALSYSGNRNDLATRWRVLLSDGTTPVVSENVHMVDCTNGTGDDYPYAVALSNAGPVAVAPGASTSFSFRLDDPDGVCPHDQIRGYKWRVRSLNTGTVVLSPTDVPLGSNQDGSLQTITPTFSNGRGRFVVEVAGKSGHIVCGDSFIYEDDTYGWWHVGTVDVNGSATPSISIGDPANTTVPALGSTVFQGDNFSVVATTSDVGVNDQTGAVQMIEWDRDNNNTTSGTGGADGYEDRRLSQPDMGASPAITTADRTATNSVSTNIGTCPTGGTYTVRARATDNGALNGADNDRKSAAASKAVTIRCRPNLQITSSHTGNFAVGMPGGGTYTIGVQNLTGASVGSTQGDTVTVTDTLPTGLVPTAWSGSGWSCGISVQTVTCTSTSALAPGASANSISVTVRPEPAALGSQPHAPKVKVAGDTEKQVTDSTIVGHSIKGDMLAQVQPLVGSVKKYTVHFELQSFPSGSVKDYYLVQIKDKDTQTVLYSNTQSPTAGTLWNSPASLSANYNFSGTPKVRGVTTGQFTLTGNNSGTSTVRFDVLPVFTNSFTGRIQIKDPNGNPVLPDPPSGTLPYWVYPTFNPTTMEFRSPTIP